MTRIKKSTSRITTGNKIETKTTEYYEVSSSEADELLKKVQEGNDEKELRNNLIKKSGW